MRILSVLASACALLAAGAQGKVKPGAKSAVDERFVKAHQKMQLTAGPVVLADASFKALTSAPRDYGVAVLLTAQASRFGCQLCREFQPEWDLLVRVWSKGDKDGASRILFGTLDFSAGRDTFISLGLTTAPVLFFFPPTSGPHASDSRTPERFDFSSGPPRAEQVHAWLGRQLPGTPHPAFSRPVNYVLLASSVTILMGVITLVYHAWPYLLPILQSRNVWAAGTMIAILLFISGHMFNHIRKMPYVTGDGRGGVTYFTSGFQTQNGLETQIIAAIYGVLTFCTICLITRVPRIVNPRTQLVTAIGLVIVMFLANSLLLRIFRIKNSGYPFSLPPFM